MPPVRAVALPGVLHAVAGDGLPLLPAPGRERPPAGPPPDGGLVSAVAEFWARFRRELELEEGRLILRASELEFHEALPPAEPGGPLRRRGHYYAWGRCSACGELRLVERAGLAGKRCILTPKCRGHLEPAEDAQDFTLEAAVGRALRAFPGAEVVS